MNSETISSLTWVLILLVLMVVCSQPVTHTNHHFLDTKLEQTEVK